VAAAALSTRVAPGRRGDGATAQVCNQVGQVSSLFSTTLAYKILSPQRSEIATIPLTNLLVTPYLSDSARTENFVLDCVFMLTLFFQNM
jgi:hypothetical protein